ncbi:conserved hypothetical protein [[Clostridium] ultunense Esp]|uniref:Uncharacterized protein n=1 Tax=[Clostridium] ultunense Esp TaxID=1288971 RepID=M1Z5R9_9FIRM|nr:conserved hypothetical protein [[Clostridium] ultunense Esp]SHD77101.1 conserved protein of unknown function [[Clostridium] ultunense Esp]
MKKKIKPTKSRKRIHYRKCGAISCINNVCGLCYIDNCELYENVLIQED